MTSMYETAKNAKMACKELLGLDCEVKNKALLNVAENILNNKDKIFKANELDLKNAHEMLDKGEINKPAYNRLKLDEIKMRDMVQGIRDIINLDDPVNKVFWKKELDDDIVLTKISCPIGVIGVIFEARPDVISQISSLAVKSSNCVILKGGREAENTNIAIFEAIKEALDKTDCFPNNVVNLIHSRDDVKEMLGMNEFIDLIIPRGGNSLVKYIQENTKIPVLGHASGICHIFVDEYADYEKSLKVIQDAKKQYPSACNAVETVLVHKNFKDTEKLRKALEQSGIQVIDNPERWDKEYGDVILSFKVVDDLKSAVNHINTYSSGHTDCIMTENEENAKYFAQNVDSAGVFHNISTRFSDGFRYGFGAEVGISTNKTHARGPVGLDGLTIYKYILEGKGQTVEEYTTGGKTFKHKFI